MGIYPTLRMLQNLVPKTHRQKQPPPQISTAVEILWNSRPREKWPMAFNVSGSIYWNAPGKRDVLAMLDSVCLLLRYARRDSA